MLIQHTTFEAQHPWPEDMFIQGGGSGAVFVRGGDSYTTAFVEVFPDTFIRGEGATIPEAEDAAWKKYQTLLACPGHEYEPRGYKNGAGFCKHCNGFKGSVFTPEDLGLSCKTCGVPTFWSRVDDDFFCPEHAMDRDSIWHRKQAEGANPTTGSIFGDLLAHLEKEV